MRMFHFLFNLSLRIACLQICRRLIVVMKSVLYIICVALDCAIALQNTLDAKSNDYHERQCSFVQLFKAQNRKDIDSDEVDDLKYKIQYLSKEKIVLETMLEKEFHVYNDDDITVSSNTSTISIDDH